MDPATAPSAPPAPGDPNGHPRSPYTYNLPPQQPVSHYEGPAQPSSDGNGEEEYKKEEAPPPVAAVAYEVPSVFRASVVEEYQPWPSEAAAPPHKFNPGGNGTGGDQRAPLLVPERGRAAGRSSGVVSITVRLLVFHVCNLVLSGFACAYLTLGICLGLCLLPLCCVGVIVFSVVAQSLRVLAAVEVSLANLVLRAIGEEIQVHPSLSSESDEPALVSILVVGVSWLYFWVFKLVVASVCSGVPLSLVRTGVTQILLALGLYHHHHHHDQYDSSSWPSHAHHSTFGVVEHCEGVGCAAVVMLGLFYITLGIFTLYQLGFLMLRITSIFVGRGNYQPRRRPMYIDEQSRLVGV